MAEDEEAGKRVADPHGVHCQCAKCAKPKPPPWQPLLLSEAAPMWLPE
jgi:hypothetical protein